MPRAKHTHKYKFTVIGKDPNIRTYRCTLPGCSHYMPNYMLANVELRSVCWNCGGEFIINTARNERTNPICSGCLELEGTSVSETITQNEDKPRMTPEEIQKLRDQLFGDDIRNEPEMTPFYERLNNRLRGK